MESMKKEFMETTKVNKEFEAVKRHDQKNNTFKEQNKPKEKIS